MISLTASQKSLSKLFTQREQYIIPDFQRPYSWGIDQCRKLYDDLVDAYNSDKDYFLGNIIMAVGEKQESQPNVVDGQQRLISLWLMFRSLSLIFPEMKVLEETLSTSNWDGSTKEIKIQSNVIETYDWKELEKVSKWTVTDIENELNSYTDKNGDFYYPSRMNKIEANCLFFYYTFKTFKENYGEQEVKKFIRFMLEDVSMLPISLLDSNIELARNKALTIFETINDRGLELADADIFKARLFVKAINEEQKNEFKTLWTDLKRACRNLNMEIDDIFRYYSHILRGIDDNTRNEISLREFFTSANATISQKTYKEIMDDLIRLTDILSQYKTLKGERTELAAWLQLIDVYTNTYPRYAVVTYLYHYGFDNTKELIHNIKSIVRYCYMKGSTTYVKFEIYNMIQMLSHSSELPLYNNPNVSESDFDYFGRLKYAYALLCMYLEDGSAINNYDFDRLLTYRDKVELSDDWLGHNLDDHLDDLGNLAVIDTYRRTKKYADKQKAYSKTEIRELKSFLMDNPHTISYENLKRRTRQKKQLLVQFFKG